MNQFEVYIANLEPTIGSEIKKTRPIVIISPDELNDHIKTVIIAPITSKTHNSTPTRVEINLQNQINFVVLDKISTLDKIRLTKCLGKLSKDETEIIKSVLCEMFS